MIAHRTLRRTVAAVLIVAGAVVILLAPPAWIGAVPLVAGLLLEAIGIAVEPRSAAGGKP